MADRCRLCTANDHDAVVEKLAADLWGSRDDRPWDNAGPTWQRIFRELAEPSPHSLRVGT